MTKTDKVLSYLEKHKTRLVREYHLTKIGVFGSVARHEGRDNSDIDLIVEFDENTPDLYTIKQRLKNELSRQLNASVDICREKYIKPVFKKHILAEAIYV